jgi:alpha-beta hydrolase superfamily lysophospholipase
VGAVDRHGDVHDAVVAVSEVNDREARWTIEGRGARFAVRAWHPDHEARRAVFIVHGLAEHAGRYQHVAEGFTDRGWSVVAADLRGHGQTTGKRGHAASIDQLMDDVHFVIVDATNRFDIHEWLLYGHSMGGAIALLSALQFPNSVRACIATGPATALT